MIMKTHKHKQAGPSFLYEVLENELAFATGISSIQ